MWVQVSDVLRHDDEWFVMAVLQIEKYEDRWRMREIGDNCAALDRWLREEEVARMRERGRIRAQ